MCPCERFWGCSVKRFHGRRPRFQGRRPRFQGRRPEAAHAPTSARVTACSTHSRLRAVSLVAGGLSLSRA
eukprot:4330970-Prymnesium_polylepis.1